MCNYNYVSVQQLIIFHVVGISFCWLQNSSRNPNSRSIGFRPCIHLGLSAAAETFDIRYQNIQERLPTTLLSFIYTNGKLFV